MFFVILSVAKYPYKKTESGLLNLWIFRYAQNDKCLRFFAAIAPCSPLCRFVLTHSAQNDNSGVDFRFLKRLKMTKWVHHHALWKVNRVNLLSKPWILGLFSINQNLNHTKLVLINFSCRFKVTIKTQKEKKWKNMCWFLW